MGKVPHWSLPIVAFGGLLGIRWFEDAKVTRWGGLSYFATFLKASQMFDRLVEDAPFVYTSPCAARRSRIIHVKPPVVHVFVVLPERRRVI